MNQSESIAKLSEALAKAQGVMEGASKDSNNPFFKSKYADLSSVWDACRKPLSDNGLSVVQTADFIPEHPDMVCLETILCHSSGEWIKGKLAVKPVKSDPQSVGSCITYLRRYSLQSIVGIAPEDDDGNAASGKQADKKQTTKKNEDDVPDYAPPTTPDRYPEEPPKLITLEQQTTLNGIIIDKGVDQEKFLKFMDVKALGEIPAKDYRKAIETLKVAKGTKAA
jgi:hypothetical protein